MTTSIPAKAALFQIIFNARQNYMRAIACLRSIFAYSTPATYDVQVKTTIKKYANEPCQKKFIWIWQPRQPIIDFIT
jgi:hypothetical protein